MIETDSKQKRQADWLKEHTLTPEQFKQLLMNKLIRASKSHEALSKREALTKCR